GHTQGGLPQGSGRILVVSVFRLVHMSRMPASFESVKESSGCPRRGDRREFGRGPRSARADGVEWDFAILTRRAEERYSVKRLIVLSASSNDPAECSVSLGSSV